jgi:predicted GNAT family N-acyltransferase
MVMIALEFIRADWMDRLFILAIFSNYLIFFGPSALSQIKQAIRRYNYRRKLRGWSEMAPIRVPGLSITVRQITAAETYPLRAAVLRAGMPVSAAIFAGDELPTTSHWGAFTPQGSLVAVASIFQAPLPTTELVGWQLRGMATDPSVRGQGYGSALLKCLIQRHRTEYPADVLWCNARIVAVGFYEAHGFEKRGSEFVIPTAGPHFVMVLWL